MADISTPPSHDLDALRHRRAELRESLGSLEEALAAPASGRAVIWGERVHTALQQLADDFAVHVTLTEGPEGLHAEIQSAAPRLSRAVATLATEHSVLAADIAALVHDTEAPVGDDDIAPVRERGTQVLGMLVRHRQRGADLVYEAFQTDLGAGD